MVDRRARGPYKQGGEKGTNRPGSEKSPFAGEKRQRFLDALTKHGVITRACAEANVSDSCVSVHRKQDAEFEQQVQVALSGFRSVIEDAIHKRGIDGVSRSIYYEGVVVGTEIVYSDSLLIQYAKRHIPEYRERLQVDNNHSGALAVGLADLEKLSPEGRKLLRDLIQKESGDEQPEA